MKLSIIVPHLKEKNLKEIRSKILKQIKGEVIFSHGIHGKGFALRKGTFKAKGNIIAWIDADLQIHPKEIRTFLKLMDLYDADAVIGNKRHSYSQVHYGFLRNMVSNGYNFLVRNLFGFSLRDTQCGMKVFRKKPLKSILDKLSCRKYAFDLETLVAMKENDFRIVDAPVFVQKQKNAGSVNFLSIITTFKDTLSIWLKKKKGYYLCR